jgi:hypothetical protein
MTSPTGSLDKGIFQKDPGKTKETFFVLAICMKNPPECLSLPTHQSPPPHQQKFPPFEPPDISQIPLKLSMASPKNHGTGTSVEFIKQRIKHISTKDQINPLKSFLGWHTPFKNQPEPKKKRNKSQSRFCRKFRQPEIIPSSGVFGTQIKTTDIEVDSLASLVLNDVDQKFKEKEKKQSISYRIILPVRIAAVTLSIHSDLTKPCTTGVEATSFSSLSFARLVWNTRRKRKKRFISNHRWMYPRSKKRKGSILQDYMLKSIDFSWTFTRKTRAAVVLYRFKYQQKIIMINPSISSEYLQSCCVFMKLTGPKRVDAIGLELLHLDHLGQNIIEKDYWTIATEETCFAFLKPNCLLQKFDRGKLSDQFRLGWQTTKESGQMAIQNYWSTGILVIFEFINSKTKTKHWLNLPIHESEQFWKACSSSIRPKQINFICLKDSKKKAIREQPILLYYRLEENWVRIESDSSKSIATSKSALELLLWKAGSNRHSQRVVRCADFLESKEVDSQLFNPGIGRALNFPEQKSSSNLDCSIVLKRALLGASGGQLHKHLITFLHWMRDPTISKRSTTEGVVQEWKKRGHYEIFKPVSMAATPF